MSRELLINPDLAAFLPPLKESESTALRAGLIADGCQDALKVWRTSAGDVLLDGHHRYAICRDLGLPYEIAVQEGVSDLQTAMEWMYRHQDGRRNWTEEQKAYVLGKHYQRDKAPEGAPPGNVNASKQLANNYPVVSQSTADRLALDYGVSPSTVKSDADYAAAVDVLDAAVPGAKARILSGKSGLRKSDVPKLAKRPRAEQQEALMADRVQEKLAQQKERREEKRKQRAAEKAVILDPEADPATRVALLEKRFEETDVVYHGLMHCTDMLKFDPEMSAQTLMRGGHLRTRALAQKDHAEQVSAWLRAYAYALGTCLGIEEAALSVVGG